MYLSLALIGSSLLVSAEPLPTDGQVRAIIDRAVPFILAEGQKWIDEKKCVTCHQVPFMVWSLNAAADRGIAVDRARLSDCGSWAVDWKNMATKAQLEKGDSKETLTQSPDAVSQLLLGRAVRELKAHDWIVTFTECLVAGQQADGSWKAGGQLPGQKRTVRETNEVTTMWAMVALQSYGPSNESVRGPVAKAREWLGSQTDGQSTEWWAARLLVECADRNEEQADRCRQSLLKNQHQDGGWGWLCAGESDAFGTGLALYALSRDGLAGDHAAIAHGRQFLIESQQDDGSWAVKGTKKDKAKKVEPTSTYWGTCWAVISLSETLPRTDVSSR
jgi:squalene-hopene/tetraprenyl-beta-curcumene cyclase